MPSPLRPVPDGGALTFVTWTQTHTPLLQGNILRAVFWPSLVLAALVGGLVLAQAYLFPGVVP